QIEALTDEVLYDIACIDHYLQTRVLSSELRQDRHQGPDGEGGRTGDAQQSARFAVEVRGHVEDGTRFVDYSARMTVDLFAGRREGNAPRVALKQTDT